jgi:hypothetical protein
MTAQTDKNTAPTSTESIDPAIKRQLTPKEYEEFQRWVALGVGGLPHTLDGYRTLQSLNRKLKNPLDTSHLDPLLGRAGDVQALNHLPQRSGTRPTIAPFAIPHRQTDQHNSVEVRDKQKAIFDRVVNQQQTLVHYEKSYFEKHNDAVFLKDIGHGNQTVVPTTHGEVGHMHPTDGSMHFSLSPSDTKEVLRQGWGELHGLAGQFYKADQALPTTYMMVYSPRTEVELAVTEQILEAAISYSALQLQAPAP